MNNLLEDRFRDPKKKIFNEDSNKSHLVNQSSIEGKSSSRPTVQSSISHQNSLAEDLKKQNEELQSSNSQLKTLLREERERYDSLFQEYEELMEKNSLIEKEYINLKYQHNRQTKDIKKGFIQQISRQSSKQIEELQAIIREEQLAQNTKIKLDKVISNLKTMPQIRVSTDKFSKSHSKRTLQLCELKEKESVLTEKEGKPQVGLPHGPQTQEMEICPLMEKIERSPEKEVTSSLPEPSELAEKDIVFFQDEYFGELQDYDAFEEKVMMRRNYELMRKNNRNSADIKRKKIFNSPVGTC